MLNAIRCLVLAGLLCVTMAVQCGPSVGNMFPGPEGPAGPQGPAGPAGADGADGANGSLRVYGDGSAGDRVVSSNENWNIGPGQPTNLQFKSLTIETGVALTVPSGMTIRVQGEFTNRGFIFVLTGAEGGFGGLDTTGSEDDLSSVTIDPVAGIATVAAQSGETGSSAVARLAGRGGIGLSEFEARQLLTISTVAGGGGAAGGMDPVGLDHRNLGARGGGALRILAMGTLTNAENAGIFANGDGQQGGGGGGGLVILASMTAVENAGMIEATGGDGEGNDTDEGPSGGGGGGIVHLLAPTVISSGTVDVAGGLGGNSGTVNMSPRWAGGGGGASGGNGGRGGGVGSGASVTSDDATDGGAGFSLITEVDPTALL